MAATERLDFAQVDNTIVVRLLSCDRKLTIPSLPPLCIVREKIAHNKLTRPTDLLCHHMLEIAIYGIGVLCGFQKHGRRPPPLSAQEVVTGRPSLLGRPCSNAMSWLFIASLDVVRPRNI